MDAVCLKTGIHGITPAISAGNVLLTSAVGRDAKPTTVGQVAMAPVQKTLSSRFSFMHPLQSLWPGGGKSERYNGMAIDNAVLVENGESSSGAIGEESEKGAMGLSERQNGNWVLKILQVSSIWKEEEKQSTSEKRSKEDGDVAVVNGGGKDNKEEEEEEEEEKEECAVCRVEGYDEQEVKLDRDSFSRLLRKVSLAEARVYAQMSYLGNLAYCIPKIKPGNLLKYPGLRFVTSSLEKKELAMKAETKQVSSNGESEKMQISPKDQEAESKISMEEVKGKEQKKNGCSMNPSTAYHIAASAASYLRSHTKSIIPFKSSKGEEGGKDSPEGDGGNYENVNMLNSDMASLKVTTDSVTAVVAAKEEVKQAVANDLSSTCSSPCEWFICDDDQSTRYFVIQGSESLASWQANLLFEPVQFEGLDVVVHRGIYEAAKGIYEQMLSEVHAHLKSYGRRATFRFTGHSLGGSLALLVNLMLIIRGELPASSLLPVITFGAPSIMCGGDHLLQKLGLPRNHVKSIAMHRDIVPRAFSCNYPNYVADLLKAVNGSFRKHPCLNNLKLLYAPMGELLILQPDEKFSPHHDLLPPGCGLYLLSCPLTDATDAEKQLQAAQTVFFNSPHPLEILSDRSAYGSGGTIQRDHEINSYLRSVRSVIRQELNHIRKARREDRRKFWWSVLAPPGIDAGILAGRPVASINMGKNQFNFSGILQTGRETLKRFSRFVASQHMHLLVILLFPARLLLLSAYSVTNIY